MHETVLLAESKLPLLSYNAPLIVPLEAQPAPTSIVIVGIVAPTVRPVNKLPNGEVGLGSVQGLKTPVYPLSTLEELPTPVVADVVAEDVFDGELVHIALIAETRYVYAVLEDSAESEYVVDVEAVFDRTIDQVVPLSVDLSIL